MEELRRYLKTLSLDAQRDFATRAGTTLGYLRKAISIRSALREKICTALERESAGAVTRRDLRPDDWQLIWPELAQPEAEREA